MSKMATIDDLEKMRLDILRSAAPAGVQGEVTRLTRWKRRWDQDSANGRSLTGPQYIDSVQIRQGAITAEKLEATLVLTTALIAGAAGGDRVELDGAGLRAYGDVDGTPNTQFYNLDADGFQLGISPNQLTFDAATGELVVPAAVIADLTIADVGSGVINANFDTSGATTKVRLSAAGIEGFASGTRTFFLDASTGAFSHIGTYTIASSTSAADRLSMTEGGIEIWKSSTRVFRLQAGGATNVMEMIIAGPSAGQYVGLNPTDGIWLGADTFANAATKFRVSPAGVLNATSAVISGAITATSGTLQTLSVTGVLTLSGAGQLTSGVSPNPRFNLSTSGYFTYGTGGVMTASIGADGTGFLGALNAITWNAAGDVTIGGFSANSTTLSSGTGGNYVTMSSGAVAFSAGDASPGAAPFHVTRAGVLRARSGEIGGWTIDSADGLKLGTTTNTRGIHTGTTAFYAGNATPGSAPFRVSTAGVLVATQATITGDITASSGSITGTLSVTGGLTVASGGTIKSPSSATYNSTGIYLDYTGATARMSLGNKFVWDGTNLTINGGGTFTGNLSAAGGTFTGTLSAASGSFSGDITGSNGTFSGTMSASNLTSGTINAATITVSNLNASNITAGTLTFGNSGTINSTGAVAGTLGNINLGNLSVTGNISLTSGSISNATGDTWSSTGILLVSAGSFGDAITWRTSGSDKLSIHTNSSTAYVKYNSGGQLSLDASGWVLSNNAGTNLLYWADSDGYFGINSDLYITDGAFSEARYLRVGSSNYKTSQTGALPNTTRAIRVKDPSGNVKRIPVYNDADTWTAAT